MKDKKTNHVPEDTQRGGQGNPAPPQTGKAHTITRNLKNYYKNKKRMTIIKCNYGCRHPIPKFKKYCISLNIVFYL